MRGRWEYASIWRLCVGTHAWVHMHAGDCGGGRMIMLTCGAWSCLQYGMTAMMLAAKNGHVEVVDRLLAAGADKDAQSKVPGCV